MAYHDLYDGSRTCRPREEHCDRRLCLGSGCTQNRYWLVHACGGKFRSRLRVRLRGRR